jgi:hypothetical protein
MNSSLKVDSYPGVDSSSCALARERNCVRAEQLEHLQSITGVNYASSAHVVLAIFLTLDLDSLLRRYQCCGAASFKGSSGSGRKF